MKIALALLLPFALTGCMLELLTSTAIQGELAAKDAAASTQALRYAKESTAKSQAEYAIRTYQAEKGAYPPSLAALVPAYLPAVPTHMDGTPFGYDPATGQLLDSATAPAKVPFTQEDERNLEQLEGAIYAYWQATGDYPRTLDDLAPQYIVKVPTMSAGGSYIYDPQTGGVYHPNDLIASPQTSAPVGAGGGSAALNETMTGIQIQNNLRNMNTSGVSTAGNAARRGVRSVNDAYNQQQQRALRELDQ